MLVLTRRDRERHAGTRMHRYADPLPPPFLLSPSHADLQMYKYTGRDTAKGSEREERTDGQTDPEREGGGERERLARGTAVEYQTLVREGARAETSPSDAAAHREFETC
jgi:hypothetical protein